MPKGVYKRSNKYKGKYCEGSIHQTDQGEIEVIKNLPREKGKQPRSIVRFTETGYTVNIQRSNIPLNKVKDRRKPSVYGVGYLDTDIKIPMRGSSSIIRRIYDLWANMLKRAYGNYKCQDMYTEVTVDKRWHSFKQFLNTIHMIEGYEEWEKNNGWHLDKDIKEYGNTIYSLDKCVFVPVEMNARAACYKRWHQKSLADVNTNGRIFE